MKKITSTLITLIAISGIASADHHGKSLFNGKDLTGWQDRNGKASKWEVVNGTLQGLSLIHI